MNISFITSLDLFFFLDLASRCNWSYTPLQATQSFVLNDQGTYNLVEAVPNSHNLHIDIEGKSILSAASTLTSDERVLDNWITYDSAMIFQILHIFVQ